MTSSRAVFQLIEAARAAAEKLTQMAYASRDHDWGTIVAQANRLRELADQAEQEAGS